MSGSDDSPGWPMVFTTLAAGVVLTLVGVGLRDSEGVGGFGFLILPLEAWGHLFFWPGVVVVAGAILLSLIEAVEGHWSVRLIYGMGLVLVGWLLSSGRPWQWGSPGWWAGLGLLFAGLGITVGPVAVEARAAAGRSREAARRRQALHREAAREQLLERRREEERRQHEGERQKRLREEEHDRRRRAELDRVASERLDRLRAAVREGNWEAVWLALCTTEDTDVRALAQAHLIDRPELVEPILQRALVEPETRCAGGVTTHERARALLEAIEERGQMLAFLGIDGT